MFSFSVDVCQVQFLEYFLRKYSVLCSLAPRLCLAGQPNSTTSQLTVLRAHCSTIQYNPTSVKFLVHYADPTVAWVGLGLSPTGSMGNGSFVIGYDGCVFVSRLVCGGQNSARELT